VRLCSFVPCPLEEDSCPGVSTLCSSTVLYTMLLHRLLF
jgi:hypothetical protein